MLTTGTSSAAAETPSTAMPVDEERSSALCLYVSSYHRGYSWSDGVERGLRETLDERCELVQFDMDTKRRRDKEDIEAAARKAAALVAELRPDVVITSDDNAAKHFVVPHLLGGDVPVVFCGVNWTAEEYGFPAKNVTGIVEVAPIRPMVREALALVPGSARAAYLGALTLTERKNYERIATEADSLGVTLDSYFVETLEEWKVAHDAIQSYDFIVVGSYSGIDHWDEAEAARHALEHASRPSLTNHAWMMPVTVIGFTKLPEEHGERAAVTARAILDGSVAGEIPLAVNRKWDTWINPSLAAAIDTPMPERLLKGAKRAESP